MIRCFHTGLRPVLCAAREWGFDQEMLTTWNSDASNLRQMMNADAPPVDPMEEWQGMPEFEQENIDAFKSIVVHFATLEDMQNFSEFINQTVTDKTKSIWYPEKVRSELLDYVVMSES